MSDLRKFFGAQGEERAKEFLLGKGYVWIASNFRTRGGEIDLIMQHGNTLVFIEVKNRRTDQYGQPEEAITRGKMQHMIQTALLFVKIRNARDKMIRFDVVTIDGNGLRHYPDAFQANSGRYYY